MGVGMGMSVGVVGTCRRCRSRLVMVVVVRMVGSAPSAAQVNAVVDTITLDSITGGIAGAATGSASATSASHYGSWCVLVPQTAELVPQDARNRTNTGNIRFVANSLAEQSISDFPGKDSRVSLL